MRTGRVLLLVGLLALAHLQASVALCGVIWRTTVLSWDNPATQLLEEVACRTVPHVDPVRQVRDRLRAALAGTDDLRVPEDDGRALPAALAACVTRAPPAA